MKTLRQKNKKEKGFTIIEVVISVAIFALISMALLNMFSSITKMLINNKALLTANTIASEQMEVIRGMKYDNVETVDGFENGTIQNESTVVRNGKEFTVLIDIKFVDDPFDGIDENCIGIGVVGAEDTTCVDEDHDGTDDRGTSLADSFWYDYKKVSVKILWRNPGSTADESFEASTNIVPAGLEGLKAGKGGIYVTVFDSQGIVISGAEVTIDSTSVPFGPVTGRTDANGNLWVPNLTPSNDYHIFVTKGGVPVYSSSETYAPSAGNPVPDRPHAEVIQQKITKMGFSIDHLGSLQVKTVHFESPSNWRANITTTLDQTDPSMTLVSDGVILVAYSDTRANAVIPAPVDLTPRIYLSRLELNTVTGSYNRAWPASGIPLITNDVKSVNKVDSLNPQLVVTPNNGKVYLIWNDSGDTVGSTDSNIYLKEVDPNTGKMVTGTSVYQVNHDATVSAQTDPGVAADKDGNLYIVWEDYRDNNWDVYAQRFDTSALTFWADGDFKVNDNTDMSDQLNPKVVTDVETDGMGNNANNFYVVWESNHSGGDFDIFMSKFNKNHVATFRNVQINADPLSLDQHDPDLAFDGNSVFYVVWSDERNPQPDIYMKKVNKNGNFEPLMASTNDLKINDDTYAVARRTKPSIAYWNDDGIYISWEDTRNGNAFPNIYTSKVKSTGVRQWEYDFLAGNRRDSVQTDVSVICDAQGKAVAIWTDNRDGTNDIYGTRYNNDMENLTRSLPLIITSRKIIGTTSDTPPVPIPKYSQAFSTDAAGNYLLSDLEWGSYDFKEGDDDYCIVSSNPPMPVTVAPDQTASILLDVCP